MNDRALTQTADQLMRAVVRSGCTRPGNEADIRLAVLVMREELKAFIGGDAKYEDERQVCLTGQSGLALASLAAECIRRILAERAL